MVKRIIAIKNIGNPRIDFLQLKDFEEQSMRPGIMYVVRIYIDAPGVETAPDTELLL